jgi:hypothetical protein
MKRFNSEKGDAVSVLYTRLFLMQDADRWLVALLCHASIGVGRPTYRYQSETQVGAARESRSNFRPVTCNFSNTGQASIFFSSTLFFFFF